MPEKSDDARTVYHGTFNLHDVDVWGELTLAGLDTQLRLRTERRPSHPHVPETLHGRLHNLTAISCVKCVVGSMREQLGNHDGLKAWSWTVQPHQVLLGNAHFDPEKDRIRRAWFATTDTCHLFDDADAFCSVWKPTQELLDLLPMTVGERPMPRGPEPRIVFFGGRLDLLDIDLPFGRLNVSHWPPICDTNTGGARIETKIAIELAFDEPVQLETCLRHVSQINQFFSLVAGRSQELTFLQVESDGNAKDNRPLEVHWLNGPKFDPGPHLHAPHRNDLPLDGVRRAPEFKRVMERWFETHDAHGSARMRLHSCRRIGN